MPTDNTALAASLEAMKTAVTRAGTVGASAVALLNGNRDAIKVAVDKAVLEDNNIDAAAAAEFKTLVDSVTAQSTADVDALDAAVRANTPQA